MTPLEALHLISWTLVVSFCIGAGLFVAFGTIVVLFFASLTIIRSTPWLRWLNGYLEGMGE